MAWNVDFYQDDDGKLPVMKWLDTLPEDVRGKVIARIDLLKEGGRLSTIPILHRLMDGSAKFGYGLEKRATGFCTSSMTTVQRSCCTV